MSKAEICGFQKPVQASHLQYLTVKEKSVPSIWKRRAPLYRRRMEKDHSTTCSSSPNYTVHVFNTAMQQ